MAQATTKALAQRAGPLTSEQLRQWNDDGYLLVRDIIPRENIDGVRRAFKRAVDGMIGELKSKGLIDDEGRDLPFETRFAKVAGEHAKRFGRSWRKVITSPELFELHRVPALVDVVGQLLGTDVIGHPVWNARPKLPGQELTVVPWHQDSGYFGADSANSKILTVWIPLVRATRANGCMQVLPGSHKRGAVGHHAGTGEGGFLELDKQADDAAAVTCEMDPGDVLIFDNLMLHQSLANTTDAIRWSVDIRYLRDGDHPGAIYWPDASARWVIRSDRQPVTTLERWTEMASGFAW